MIHTSPPPSNSTATVLVVMGSIRAGRRCPQMASWVIAQAKACSNLVYEPIDLADWPLPMDDEAGIPAAGTDYAQEHTRAWSRKVAAAAGFVFVTPQYNWGYPAALKNAIDHLYKEWHGKPAVIITYGGHAGDKCAAQLRQVLEAVHLRPVATMPGIRLTREMIGRASVDPEKDFEADAERIRQAMCELATDLEGSNASAG